MNTETELKIYKRLAEIRGNFLHNIFKKLVACNNNRPDVASYRKTVGEITKPSVWAESGLMTPEEKAELEFIKFLLEGEDDQCEIKRYGNHIKNFGYYQQQKKRV